MKAYTHNLVFGALLFSAATACADNIQVCAPGIKDPQFGTRTYIKSTSEIPLVSDAPGGKFYSYRVMGFYNQLEFPTGPWKTIENGDVKIYDSDGKTIPFLFPFEDKSLRLTLIGNLPFPLGWTDTIYKHRTKFAEMRTTPKFYPANGTIGYEFKNQALKLKIEWNSSQECGRHMFGYVNLKVEYIPEKPNTIGSLSAPNYAAETSLPSLDWKIVRQGVMQYYDPGHSTIGKPAVTDSSVVNNNNVNPNPDVTEETTVGKNNNGHGNNIDGVDVSNPGQGKGGPNGMIDPSGAVDDEGKKK